MEWRGRRPRSHPSLSFLSPSTAHPADPAKALAVYSNFEDQRLYGQAIAADGSVGAAAPLTAAPAVAAGSRYADLAPDPARPRAYCVLETHADGGGEPAHAVAAVDLASGAVTVLATGSSDFVSSPTPSPDGASLAWVRWSHPNMPWDDTELVVARVDAATGALGPPTTVAGGPGVSVQAPTWLPDGSLAFVSDQDGGWWNVWVTREGAAATPLARRGAEFAGPPWVGGTRPLVLLPGGGDGAARLLVKWGDPGAAGATLGILVASGPDAGALTPLHTPYTGFSRVAVAAPGAGKGGARLALVGAHPARPGELATAALDGAALSSWTPVAKAATLAVDPAFLSAPEVIEFPTTPVPGGVDAVTPPVAYMNYYPPASATHALPAGAPPPLLVKIHGGPTAAAGTGLSLGVQYWTSRGFAVADVNYRGSTGLGRAYRKALAGVWGLADVADVAAVGAGRKEGASGRARRGAAPPLARAFRAGGRRRQPEA